MKKDLTEVLFIIDKSGSMFGLEENTIGGFNKMIKKQKKLPGEVLVTTVLFDTVNTVLHDRTPLRKIKSLTERDYCAEGCTALLDAVGKYVKRLRKAQKAMDKDERPAKTMVVIITDGHENSSRKYTYPQVKQLLEKQQKKHGWEVIFLGANIDVAAEAENLGIDRDMAMSYVCDAEGINDVYDASCCCMSAMRKDDGGKKPKMTVKEMMKKLKGEGSELA